MYISVSTTHKSELAVAVCMCVCSILNEIFHDDETNFFEQ